MTCEICNDSDGACVFPYYGLAPHHHVVPLDGTVFADKAEWPDNFVEDPECPGLGTYTNCPLCNAPDAPTPGDAAA